MRLAGVLAGVLGALWLLGPAPAAAHKVIADIYPAGAVLEGEISFSNGEFAANKTVIVTDPEGRALGETMTDEEGVFTFRPTGAGPHVFRADLGMGHVALVEVSAEEIARILAAGAAMAGAPQGTGAVSGAVSGPVSGALPGPAAATPAAAVGAAGGAAGGAAPVAALAAAPLSEAGFSPAQLAEIGRVMRDEMRPLRREIAAYREKTGITAILGGLGWIAGLCGVGFYFAARKRLEDDRP